RRAECDVGQRRLVAASISDPALPTALLTDQRVWRMLHNAGYDVVELERAWASFTRSRPPSRALESTTFGEYLARSSEYTTRLGAPVSRPVVSVIPAWGTMTMAQRARAVVEVAEPRL